MRVLSVPQGKVLSDPSGDFVPAGKICFDQRTMHPNSNLLVLCHDTATGFAQIGWAADLPPGRFIHLAVICESAERHPLTPRSPHFQAYQTACAKARELNQAELLNQVKANTQQGRLPVPLSLAAGENLGADEFGSSLQAAMRTLHRLTGNCQAAWAVVMEQEIIHVRSRRPDKPFNELEYQVWKHHTLSQLENYHGEIIAGRLLVQESGLWFEPEGG